MKYVKQEEGNFLDVWEHITENSSDEPTVSQPYHDNYDNGLLKPPNYNLNINNEINQSIDVNKQFK
jgi:hypothetical protein